MFSNSFRLLLALVLLGSLTLSSCVVREHGRRGYGNERHDRGDRGHDRDRRY